MSKFLPRTLLLKKNNNNYDKQAVWDPMSLSKGLQRQNFKFVVPYQCPPPPLQRDCKDDFKPWPSCIDWFAAPPSPILHSYWLAARPIARSRFLPPEGEGGDCYYITQSRMAEVLKDPCISHIDASHVEWPRTESSLLFCIFFYIVKIIEKSLFYEQEIGFIRK